MDDNLTLQVLTGMNAARPMKGKRALAQACSVSMLVGECISNVPLLSTLAEFQATTELKYGTNLCVKRLRNNQASTSSSPSEYGTAWLELSRSSADVYPEADSWLSVHQIISAIQSCHLQVTWPNVCTITVDVFFADATQLAPAVEQLLSDSGFTLCSGIAARR